MKINWQDNLEVVSYALLKRQEGLSFKEVAKLCSVEFNFSISKDQIQKACLVYGPDRDLEASVTGQALVSQRNSQLSAVKANKKVRMLSDLVLTQEEVLKELKEYLKATPKHRPTKLKKASKGDKMTIELLFSDWQIGKKMSNYNSDVAIRRLKEYTSSAIFKIKQHIKSGYDVEKVCLILLGDIIESAEKATQKGSPRSVDCSTAVQLQLAIKHIFEDLLIPLAQLGIKLEVYSVPGNHDHIGPGMVYYNPGEEHLSWTIYKSLELLCEHHGFTHVKHVVPVGYFTVVDYYGQKALYEHGVALSVTEAALNARKNQRMRQLGQYIAYFRMGDKHNISRFNDDSLVVNGAFFGADDQGTEYSSISGYASVASQLMFAHVKRRRGDTRTSIYDSFSIQLNHIK